jgi:hypothetical protein
MMIIFVLRYAGNYRLRRILEDKTEAVSDVGLDYFVANPNNAMTDEIY